MPTGIVTIEIKKVKNVPSGALTGAQRPYVVATVAGRFFGRSRVVSTTATEFSLAAEPTPWRLNVPFDGADLPISLKIIDDRGDASPLELVVIDEHISAPYTGGTRSIGGLGPQIECHLATRIVPLLPVPAAVPRASASSTTRATIAVRNTLIVHFVNIGGLYHPGYAPSRVPNPKRSEPHPGYRSEDDRGRIFLNRSLTGSYQRNTQLIELHARVEVIFGRLPAGSKLKWTVVDPDDPFDGDPNVHRQWAPYIDARDYDAAGHPTGARGNDNEGRPDHSPAWEQSAGFPLTVVSAHEAETSIVSLESKVILHCPNVAGDNLIVRVTVDSPRPATVFETETGLMTMWHRIDAEYAKMTSAFPLPVDQVPPFFDQASAELNFTRVPDLPDQQFMSPDEAHLDDNSAAYVNTHFSHHADPGWFCVISAMEPHTLPTTPGGGHLHRRCRLARWSTGGRARGVHRDPRQPPRCFLHAAPLGRPVCRVRCQ